VFAQTEGDGFSRESRSPSATTSSPSGMIARIAGSPTILPGSERTSVFACLSIPSRTLPAGDDSNAGSGKCPDARRTQEHGRKDMHCEFPHSACSHANVSPSIFSTSRILSSRFCCWTSSVSCRSSSARFERDSASVCASRGQYEPEPVADLLMLHPHLVKDGQHLPAVIGFRDSDGRMPAESAIPTLGAALADEESAVRQSAASPLREIQKAR